MQFINVHHEKRFIKLLNLDNTHSKDCERLSLFYILSGNNDLLDKVGYIYDFKNHQIEPECIESEFVDFCSSSKALIKLGFNLYNGFNDDHISPVDLFQYLDSDNYVLAQRGCNLRFGMIQVNEMEVEEEAELDIIQSFSINDKLTGETAHEIGQKLLQNFGGFQGVIATHIDRQHIHNHIVLNSVNWETGLKWQQSKKDLQELKDLSDKLCVEYGLSVVEKGKGWQSYGEREAVFEGGSWKQDLAQKVAVSIKKSGTREEFTHYLHKDGIEVEFNKDSLLFLLSDGKKCGSDIRSSNTKKSLGIQL